MKPWMKVLMWFGLGASLGFFVGQRAGYNQAKREDEQIVNDAYTKGFSDGSEEGNPFAKLGRRFAETAKNFGYIPRKDPETGEVDAVPANWEELQQQNLREMQNDMEAAKKARENTGDILQGRKMSDIESASALFDDPPEIPADVIATVVDPNGEDEEDAEMPMDEPVMPDDGIEMPMGIDEGDPNGDIGVVQFHPTYTAPRVVSHEEYDSRGDLDETTLIFYEGDEVLYCTSDQKPMGPEDQYSTIGVGTLNEFHAGPGPAKDEIYVINDTYGRFKIIRVDGAFTDEVDGCAGPSDDDADDPDYWNNGDC